MAYPLLLAVRAAVVSATLALAACASGGGADAGFGQPVQSSPPTVSITASPTSLQQGATSTLSWSSTDATGCVASGGWSGNRAASGSEVVTPTASASYVLTCTGAGGSAERSVSVTVTAAPGSNNPPPVASAGVCSSAMTGLRTFDVGPGKTYTELTQVPWLSLRAGDVVNVFHRATPYRTKIGIRAQGTASNPVVINGVTDANCNRPEINAANAVTATDLAQAQYFSAQYSENLGAILIYKQSSDAYGYKPKFIQIKNLKISGARPVNSYTNQAGGTTPYNDGAAAIYAVTVEDLLVQNCEISDNANGLFVNTKNDVEQEASYRVTVRNNAIFGNGNSGSYLEHNLYVQAAGAVYEGNFIGQLRPGALGSSLKDRSSGTIVRYNYIRASARALDLVETEGGATTVARAADYNDAWVYGNVIVNDYAGASESSALLIHWGGDKGIPSGNKSGTLYFYYNTVINRSTSAQAWRIGLFDMPTDTQKVELFGNIFANYGDSLIQMGSLAGQVRFTGTNWITTGWGDGKETGNTVTVTRAGTLVEGTNPGFVNAAGDDFTLAAGSPAVDAGTASAPSSVSAKWISLQRVDPVGTAVRSPVNGAFDLGAFERP